MFEILFLLALAIALYALKVEVDYRLINKQIEEIHAESENNIRQIAEILEAWRR